VNENFSQTDNFSYRGEALVPYTEVERWAREIIQSGYRKVKLRLRREAEDVATNLALER